MVPTTLDLVEIGSPADLKATVVAIEPCPPIADGPGQVILTTVDHFNSFVFKLTVTGDDGSQETLGVTGYHKFYSETRKAWVSAKDLRQGESLGYLNRPVTVAGLQRLPGTHRVYNLTVEGEHVYYVSALGALVHNNGCSDAARVKEQRKRRRIRRERRSRIKHGQNQKGEGFRPTVKKGPSGVRPKGPGGQNRERNIGIDEEHGRVAKGTGGGQGGN